MNTLPTLSSCSACGTSPVNHRLARLLNIIDEILGKTAGRFFATVHLPFENILADTAYGWLAQLLLVTRLARTSTDKSKAITGRSELIWEEAERRGIMMEQIVFRGKYLEQYRALINGRWFYFESLPIPSRLSQRGYAWADDKLILAQKLEAAGVPTPKARCVTSWSAALQAFDELSKPVIIKPRNGSRGRHTTTHITTAAELRAAYDLAQEIARELVIEEHLFGSVCRATLVDGKLVGFFRADPPRIAGDGVHTVRELIEKKNADRHERLGAVEITDDLISYIGRRGYTLESVLPAGVSLDLSAKTGRFYGGTTEEMLPKAHPKMHGIFEKAARVVDAPVIGFDLITTDPTADPDSLRWGVIECNSLPFIDLHYYALHGEPNNVAARVWDLWDSNK